MVEHSTADREVPGSNPGAPSLFLKYISMNEQHIFLTKYFAHIETSIHAFFMSYAGRKNRKLCAYSAAKASSSEPLNLHTPVPQLKVSKASHIKPDRWPAFSGANYS